MNKEIDEIIEQIKTAIRFKKMPIPSDYHISIYDMEQLLNYITNLQERNNNLKEDFKRHIDRINELTERNDKAIEYTKHLRDEYFRRCIFGSSEDLSEIIDILRGENNR